MAPDAGMVRITVGAVESAVLPVVKLQTWLLARALPAALCAAVVMVAVYCVLGSRFAVGANVAVFVAATYVTVPGTAAPPVVTARVNVAAAVIVPEFMASLNVAVIFWFMGTLVAPFRGFVEITDGIVPVVKVHTKLLARWFPRGSAAPVVIVPVYTVLAARAALGVNVAVMPEYVTTPATAPPGAVTVKVDVLMVAAFIASLKVAVIICAVGTPVALLAGAVETTVGTALLTVCSRPHPARKTPSRSAIPRLRDHILLLLNFFICAPLD